MGTFLSISPYAHSLGDLSDSFVGPIHWASGPKLAPIGGVRAVDGPINRPISPLKKIKMELFDQKQSKHRDHHFHSLPTQ